jgi:hypothetical protein
MAIFSRSDIWDKFGSPEAAAATRTNCRDLRPKWAGYWAWKPISFRF